MYHLLNMFLLLMKSSIGNRKRRSLYQNKSTLLAGGLTSLQAEWVLVFKNKFYFRKKRLESYGNWPKLMAISISLIS